jgi:iron complex outermembrane receptor protein
MIAGILCVSPIVTAYAQSADSSGQIDEIIVTAEKRSQSIQNVPAAVTAVSGEGLADLGITDQTELAQVVPGLVIGDQTGAGEYFLRGVGQTQGSPNAQTGISVNLNGIATAREAGVLPLYDMERVEVLPGPQGTLYGSSAAGGVINFITKRPVLGKFTADASLEVGNYSLDHPTAALNLPIGDSAALRLSGEFEHHTGYFTNGSNDLEQGSGRITFLAEPTSRLSVLATAMYVHDGGIGSNYVDYVQAKDVRNLYDQDFSTAGLYLHRSTEIAQGEIRYKVTDSIDLTYLPGWIQVLAYDAHIFVGLPSLFTTLLHQNTQELRLSGDTGPFSWISGLYWYDSTHGLDALVGTPPFRAPVVNVDFQNHIQGDSVFGEGTYHATDRLRFTVGARFSSDYFNGYEAETALLPPPPKEELAGNDQRRGRADYKVGTQFDLSSMSMAYASIQSGYLIGGYTQSGQVFAPETLTAYTGGIKNRLLDGSLVLNFEGFYYDYKGYQLQYTQGIEFLVDSAPARIYGGQVDVVEHVAKGTTLNFNALVESAEIQTSNEELFDRDAKMVSIRGYQLPNAPTTTLTLGLEQRFGVGPGDVVFNGQVYFNSGYWMDFTHDLNTHQSSYTRSDMSLMYEDSSKRWSAGLFVRNAENNGILIGANKPSPDLSASNSFLYAPRTFGARFEYHLF